jgi:hypothetical protein
MNSVRPIITKRLINFMILYNMIIVLELLLKEATKMFSAANVLSKHRSFYPPQAASGKSCSSNYNFFTSPLAWNVGCDDG